MSNLFTNLSVVLRPWSRDAASFDLEASSMADGSAVVVPPGSRVTSPSVKGALSRPARSITPVQASVSTGLSDAGLGPACERIGPSEVYELHRPGVRVSPLAHVDPRAELGDGVEIGPFCVVGPHVRLGDRCRLLNNVTVLGRTTVGEDNVFFPNSVIGSDPQDKKFNGEATALEIGDRNQFREAVTVHLGTARGGGVTRVGSHNLFMVNAHLGHDVRWGDHTVVGNNVMVAGHVVCGDFVALMGGVGVHHYVTIGRFAYAGGYARIHHDVPPFTKIDGSDEVRGINAIGMSRHGVGPEDVSAVDGTARRLFFRKGVALATGLREVSETITADPAAANPYVRELVDFLHRRDLGRHGRYLEGLRVR